MTPATTDRRPRGVPGRVYGTPYSVRLDGWAQIGAANYAHYVRDGLAICRARNDGGAVKLLGSLKDRECCPRCLERLAAVQ